MQQNIYDTRSGLNVNSVYAYVYKQGASSKGSKIPLYKYSNYSDFSNSINFDSYSHLSGVYGNIVVEVYATDNVGNEGKVSSKTVTRILPKPTATDVVILDYEYEDSTTKWVKADNEFKIYQSGYVTGVNPSKSNLRISKNTDYNNSSVSNAYSLRTNSFGSWSSNTPYIVRNRNTFLNVYSSGGKNYGSADYYFVARKELNGQKFYVYGSTEADLNGTSYVSNYIRDSKLLGIDGQSPSISYVKTGRDEITITVRDNESGIRHTVVRRQDGSTVTNSNGSFVVDLKDSDSTTITSTDNVGNINTITVGDIKTVITANIKTEEVLVNGRKKLKVTATATVKNPVPNKVLTLNLDGNGDGITFTSGSTIHSSKYSMNYSFLIDDVYNQSYGPNVNYSSDKVTYANVTFDRISDLKKNYNFYINSKYDFESSWKREASKSASFDSDESKYKYSIYRMTDENFTNLPSQVLVMEKTVSPTQSTIDVSSLKSGKYCAKVYMYDYNGNISGMGYKEFQHIQPLDSIDLNLEVTAVKDIAWEKETYPISYLKDKSKFPIGKNYKFNNNDIKLGYAINFSLEDFQHHTTLIREVEYVLRDHNNVELKGSSNGSLFTDLDRSENTGYIKQINTIPVTDGKFRFKHFLPANAEFYYSDNSGYRGYVTISVRFKLEENGLSVTREVPLYCVTTSDTAYDDLYLDKQR